EQVDAVSVCLPNYLHAPVSIAALHAGNHVLCEKPMATSSEEAQQMIEAAEKNNKKLMIGHNQRFVSSHQKAKELIATGALGKITASGQLLVMVDQKDGVRKVKIAGSLKKMKPLLVRW